MMTATLPSTLNVALKEWAVVCRAMQQGRQILLLRKGGIHESGGEFEIEHRHFLFFPTYLHQNPRMLKEEAHAGFEPHSTEPAQLQLAVAGYVTDIIQLQSRQQMDELDDLHIWTSPLVDLRFNYRPENPLYLLIVRASRLGTPVMVENTPAYAGCKSWVPLEQTVSTAGATPVLSDTDFQVKRQLIRARLGQADTGF